MHSLAESVILTPSCWHCLVDTVDTAMPTLLCWHCHTDTCILTLPFWWVL